MNKQTNKQKMIHIQLPPNPAPSHTKKENKQKKMSHSCHAIFIQVFIALFIVFNNLTNSIYIH